MYLFFDISLLTALRRNLSLIVLRRFNKMQNNDIFIPSEENGCFVCFDLITLVNVVLPIGVARFNSLRSSVACDVKANDYR